MKKRGLGTYQLLSEQDHRPAANQSCRPSRSSRSQHPTRQHSLYIAPAICHHIDEHLLPHHAVNDPVGLKKYLPIRECPGPTALWANCRVRESATRCPARRPVRPAPGGRWPRSRIRRCNRESTPGLTALPWPRCFV